MTGHPELETLAQLAEERLPAEAAGRVRGHLERCPECAAVLAHAATFRAAWLANEASFALRTDEARRLADETGRSLSPRSRRPAWRLVPAAAAAVLVVAAGWFAFAPSRPAPTLTLQLPPAVRAASEWSSARALVLPGAANGANSEPSTMRSDGERATPQLSQELDELLARYESGPAEATGSARLVAGLLAANDLEAARAYVREGLRRHPGDIPLLIFAADVAFRSSDLPAAEDRLRAARERAPRDPVVALDLALVLRQRGKSPEARELLAQVARSPVRPLAERARRELAGGH